jgi:hypothetical protein
LQNTNRTDKLFMICTAGSRPLEDALKGPDADTKAKGAPHVHP